ncbi:putative transposase [Trichonephila clavipes]|nr:putative transposase [Trichonephila clavipes]
MPLHTISTPRNLLSGSVTAPESLKHPQGDVITHDVRIYVIAGARIQMNRFLASKNIPVAPQSPYSPDLSPCDFFLFPKLKNHLKGHHFGTLKNIQTTVTDQLKAIRISEFHQCYEEWKKRLQHCVASEDSYFEGDNVEL